MTPYQQAAQAQQGALGATQGAMQANMAGPNDPTHGVGAYMNPYQQQVIDRTQNEMNRQNQIAQSNNAAGAANAGAFGGSRHGLVEAQTNAATNRNIGDMTANMLHTGYGQAMNDRQQAFQNQMSSAQQMSNLGQGSFGYGTTLDDRQMAQGNQAQQMNQALLTQAAGMFDQYVGSPTNMLNLRNTALGSNPLTQTGTSTATSGYNPGMMDYLGLGAGVAGSALGAK
jgi:hypothetical protein